MATTATEIPKTALNKAEKLLARYADVSRQLDQLKQARKPLEEEYSQLRTDLQTWADDPANAGAFAEKATLSLKVGSIGYRNSTEALVWDLEKAPAGQARVDAVCAVLKKQLPTAVKTSYDEKAIVKVWPHMLKLQEQLAELGVQGIGREKQFIVTLSK